MTSLLGRMCVRHLHVSSVLLARNSMGKLSVTQMSKLMDKTLKKFKTKEPMMQDQWMFSRPVENSPAVSSQPLPSLRTNSTRHRQRLNGLCRIYLQHITEHMSNSGHEFLSQRALQSRLEITRVMLSGNMSRLYIYWTCGSQSSSSSWMSPSDQLVQQLQKDLAASCSRLRELLSQQHVTSHMPCISFVYDESVWRYDQLQRRLATVDYGPEYAATDPLLLLKKQLANNQPITEQLRQESLDAVEQHRSWRMSPPLSDDDEDRDDDDVLKSVDAGGLNREIVMSEVMKNMRQSSDAYHRYQKTLAPSSGESSSDAVDSDGGVTIYPEAVTPQHKRYSVYRRIGQTRSRSIKYQLAAAKRQLKEDLENIHVNGEDH